MTTTAPHPQAEPADRGGAEPRTLYELFEQTTTAHPTKVAFRRRVGGDWEDVRWSEHRADVLRIARALCAAGVQPGDRVAILSGTRLEWVACDSAIVNIGAVTVGIYHSNLPEECAHVLEHSGAKLLFAENDEQLEKVLSVRSRLPELATVVVFEGRGDPATGVLDRATFLARGDAIDEERVHDAGRATRPEDLASLVYTSGTTGVPKAAMISHRNLVFTSDAATGALHIEPDFCTLLFLPLAHVYARMLVYMCQRAALTTVFADDIRSVPADLREIRPHFIASVPRIYEKIHEKVVTTAHEAGGLKRRLFDWAVEAGRLAAGMRLERRRVPLWTALQQVLADRLVLHKVREAFGGRLVWGASGAAPLNLRVNEFFHACGVTIVEGLGMTENTSLSNANRLDHNKPGTVGPTIPGVEMKLAEDGEVLFRGPNVMLGYYRDPQATAETIDAEGWLHSGDIGEIDEDGFLTITDRKKDLIITAGGKNVAPQRVEKILRTSRYISQVVACGDRRKFISALVTLDGTNVGAWAEQHGVGSRDPEAMARDPRVRELIGTEIAERNRELASYESVKQFRILPHDLSIETGELTPTLKIRRKVVTGKYRELLEEMYRE